jgi:hypothetical protein
MPHAGVVQALTGVTVLQLAQIESGAEVLTLAINNRGAHAGGHFFKQIAQRQNEAVVERVALFAAGETDDGNFLLLAANFEMEVFIAHGFFQSWRNYGYKK